HLESAYDAFRMYCKRTDYRGELVDTKALRRLIHENHRAGGYVVAPSERVCFAGKSLRRCALVIDVAKVPFISAEDFPHVEEASRGWRGQGYGFAEEGAS
ncbi:hypothetical protein, partial [Myxococcus xanthus]